MYYNLGLQNIVVYKLLFIIQYVLQSGLYAGMILTEYIISEASTSNSQRGNFFIHS